MQKQRGRVTWNALFPRVPSELRSEFRAYLNLPARRVAVTGAVALLVIIPALLAMEIWIVRPGDPIVLSHIAWRAPVLMFAAVILLLWYFRPEGSWPRPLGLLFAVAMLSAITGRFAHDMLIPRVPLEHALLPLVILIGAVPIFAIGGVRDLAVIYGVPLTGFLAFLWQAGLPAEIDRALLVYPLLTMPVGVFIAHILSSGHARTFLAGVELRKSAMTDMLTGLLNRRAMDRELTVALAAANRHQRRFALVMADIDHFKRINDTHGHDVGDQVLMELSARLRDSLRTEDRIARWGGEEFLVLLYGQGDDVALSAAEKLRRAVAATPLSTSAGPLDVTISLGVAGHGGAETIDDLLIRVDAALYQAKRDGRNRSVLAEAGATS